MRSKSETLLGPSQSQQPNIISIEIRMYRSFSNEGKEYLKKKKNCPSEARTHDLPMSFPNHGITVGRCNQLSHGACVMAHIRNNIVVALEGTTVSSKVTLCFFSQTTIVRRTQYFTPKPEKTLQKRISPCTE